MRNELILQSFNLQSFDRFWFRICQPFHYVGQYYILGEAVAIKNTYARPAEYHLAKHQVEADMQPYPLLQHPFHIGQRDGDL